MKGRERGEVMADGGGWREGREGMEVGVEVGELNAALPNDSKFSRTVRNFGSLTNNTVLINIHGRA